MKTEATTTFCDRIDRQMAGGAARRPFLVIDGEATDHAAFIDRMRRTFAVFGRKNLGRGDRVAIVSTHVLNVATLMLAGVRYGLGMVNLNPDISARDFAIAVPACQLSHLFIDRAIFEKMALPAGLACTIIEAGIAKPRGMSLLDRLRSKPVATAQPTGLDAELAVAEACDPPPSPAADATAMMLFTSGTTSAPKVVELSHANLTAQIEAFFEVFDYDASSRILNPLPLHFTDGMLHGPMVAFVNGATLYRPTSFDFQKLEDLVHSIYRDRISHFIVVPALLSMLDRLSDAFGGAFDGSDFRYIRSSGDLLPETLWRSIEKRFGVRVVNTYGMSETVCEALYAGPDPATHRVGTIGKPVGCRIRIVDEAGLPVSTGETGELLIQGDIVMKGYLAQPDLTASAFLDGWLRTGDFASQDADGFVRIVGRKKSLIITGGVNVQPQDISDCLLTHPAVAEAVTFGVPHAMWGEQVAAAIRLKSGAIETSRNLIAHCEAGLSPHKVPRLLMIVDELPRNPAGKVLVDVLRGQLAALDDSVGSAGDSDLFEQVRRIAAGVFSVPVESLRLTSEPATTLGWDSLAHLNLIAATERHFSIGFAATDVLRIHTLADVVAAVTRLRTA